MFLKLPVLETFKLSIYQHTQCNIDCFLNGVLTSFLFARSHITISLSKVDYAVFFYTNILFFSQYRFDCDNLTERNGGIWGQWVTAVCWCCTSNMKAQPLPISWLPVIPSMHVIWADWHSSVVSSAKQHRREESWLKWPKLNKSPLHVHASSFCADSKELIELSAVMRKDIQ